MTRALWNPAVAFLALALVTLLLGLWEVGWRVAALPDWFWGAVVLMGLLMVFGNWLTAQARSQPSFWWRAALFGAGWGLPVSSLLAALNTLEGDFVPGLHFTLWTALSLVYGVVTARRQPPA